VPDGAPLGRSGGMPPKKIWFLRSVMMQSWREIAGVG